MSWYFLVVEVSVEPYMLGSEQRVDHTFYFGEPCMAFKDCFSYFLFHHSLNPSCTLALLLFLYCTLDRSACRISVPIMAAAIFLSLSLLVGRIGGFILG